MVVLCVYFLFHTLSKIYMQILVTQGQFLYLQLHE